MKKKTLVDIDAQGLRALVRVDFNVPLDDGKVSDDQRIRAALPTLERLLDQGASLILMSHLGRPKGKPNEALRMDPVAAHLAQLLHRPVRKLDDCVGPDVEAAAKSLKAGEILLLENLRFHPQEKANEPAFAAALASLGEVFVNDAFGTAHRAHASTAGVPERLKPAVAGLLMEKEITYLGRTLADPEKPFVAILGGAKVGDKIGVIDNLLPKVEALLIGGGMANTFLAAQGHDMADSLVEEDALDNAKTLLDQAGSRLHLPVDAVVADSFAAEARSQVVPVDQIPQGWRMLDVGPATLKNFSQHLESSKTVVWNGPMGVFEFPAFAAGTFGLAETLGRLTRNGVTTIIGGGDSAAAVHQAGLANAMSHISTGGGASLEFMEGKSLPGVAALEDGD
ncbi:MAG: phosphoglycerate kinase [Deltaproteobacteria bacterium]|nr:phosphoglycerate kinase [Deltaproteobacteria bacterium]